MKENSIINLGDYGYSKDYYITESGIVYKTDINNIIKADKKNRIALKNAANQ